MHFIHIGLHNKQTMKDPHLQMGRLSFKEVKSFIHNMPTRKVTAGLKPVLFLWLETETKQMKQ